jgi:hypothetical protein
MDARLRRDELGVAMGLFLCRFSSATGPSPSKATHENSNNPANRSGNGQNHAKGVSTNTNSNGPSQGKTGRGGSSSNSNKTSNPQSTPSTTNTNLLPDAPPLPLAQLAEISKVERLLDLTTPTATKPLYLLDSYRFEADVQEGGEARWGSLLDGHSRRQSVAGWCP